MSEPELLTPEELESIAKSLKTRYKLAFNEDVSRKMVSGTIEALQIIIPARIAEAIRETLEKIADTQEEIDNMVAKAVAEERAKLVEKVDAMFAEDCYKDCPRGVEESCVTCIIEKWQSIKELKI